MVQPETMLSRREHVHLQDRMGSILVIAWPSQFTGAVCARTRTDDIGNLQMVRVYAARISITIAKKTEKKAITRRKAFVELNGCDRQKM